MVLLTDDVAVRPVVVVDQPCCCDAAVKQIYTRPRHHSTRPDATHEHAREREKRADTPRTQRDTQISSRVTRNCRSTRYYTTDVLYNETETFVFLCNFAGVTAPYV